MREVLMRRATAALAVGFLVAPPAQAEEIAENEEHVHGGMMMEDPIGLGMSREGSGTAWQPDTTPQLGHHLMAGDWMFMLHYVLFAGYDASGSDRGDHQFFSTNWVMGMAQHELLGGQLTGRAMLSLEPLTVSHGGYPLLLQTGETIEGRPLHDHQHPHDLFMEVAVKYNHAITDGLAIEIYAAASGEPALGPVAMAHRFTASSDPLAPLGHHWEDSTHVSFGVLTGGLYTEHVKLEGSYFNGREPDENRYDFDFRPLDSYAFRLSVNPVETLSCQASYGFLKSPEQLQPDQSVRRITASGTYDQPLGGGDNLAATLIFGRNIPSLEPPSNAVLLEGNLALGSNELFGRGELVQKTGNDLVLPAANGATLYPLGSLDLGYLRNFGPYGGVVPGIGVRGSIAFLGADLEPFYGSRQALGAVIFVRLQPGPMLHGG
jgi:hypothetical protein